VNTCDKFISWGWDDAYDIRKNIPTFVLKLANIRKLKNDSNGGILLIKRGPGRRDGCHDRYFEHILYQRNVLNFFSLLNDSLQNRTTIRLHHGSTELNSSDERIWRDKYKDVDIDSGFSNINKLIKRSRIVVHSYDSTGMLETLYQDIPTIAFWRNNLDDVMIVALPYYSLLIKVGILHLNVESAASHLNKHWNSIDLWWGSSEVQSARMMFCNKYAKNIDNLILALSGLLNKK
jgi:putative transferase (TIGR04331 family)